MCGIKKKGGGKMKKLNTLDFVSLVLVIIGGLNWGLIGAFKFNLVQAILGNEILGRVVYVLVGLAAVYAVSLLSKTENQTKNPEN